MFMGAGRDRIGADCAGAVQFAPPEKVEQLEGPPSKKGSVEWLTEAEVAKELKTVREQGIPGAAAFVSTSIR
jgi:hypothetical protein